MYRKKTSICEVQDYPRFQASAGESWNLSPMNKGERGYCIPLFAFFCKVYGFWRLQNKGHWAFNLIERACLQERWSVQQKVYLTLWWKAHPSIRVGTDTKTVVQTSLETKECLQPLMLSTCILQERPRAVPKASPIKHGLGLNSTKLGKCFLNIYYVHLLATVSWRLRMMVYLIVFESIGFFSH